MLASHQRRRSHSMSAGQPCGNCSLKRSHPQCSEYQSRETASSPKWEINACRVEKRRRKEHSPVYPLNSRPQLVNDVSQSAMSTFSSFACTPADFHLYPRHKREPRRRSTSQLVAMDADSAQSTDFNPTNLSLLRSAAFWELRTSITQNEEGFVQRMRDYENSRSRSAAFQKAKEAHKRGRKKSSLVTCQKRVVRSLQPSMAQDEESDEEECILVLSSDLVPCSHISSPCHRQLHHSADMALSSFEINEPSSAFTYSDQNTPQQTSFSSLEAGQPQLSFSARGSQPIFGSSTRQQATPAADSVASRSSTGALAWVPHSHSSPSDKAIAALSLAMASGAVGLNDYQALLAIQEAPAMDACHVGEMFD